jgi:hypothetical protein
MLHSPAVERIEEYQMQALRLGKKRFAETYPSFFLVKRPEASRAAPSQDASIEYETVSWVSTDPAVESGDETFAAEWRVAPVKKHPKNPFPDRISVGRARNCDIVLRLPFMSKLHAHFRVADDGSMSLVDLRSANGTLVNNAELAAGTAAPVKDGDAISFGSLELELVSPSRLYDILLNEARR